MLFRWGVTYVSCLCAFVNSGKTCHGVIWALRVLESLLAGAVASELSVWSSSCPNVVCDTGTGFSEMTPKSYVQE